jgi:hypothetical protein
LFLAINSRELIFRVIPIRFNLIDRLVLYFILLLGHFIHAFLVPPHKVFSSRNTAMQSQDTGGEGGGGWRVRVEAGAIEGDAPSSGLRFVAVALGGSFFLWVGSSSASSSSSSPSRLEHLAVGMPPARPLCNGGNAHEAEGKGAAGDGGDGDGDVVRADGGGNPRRGGEVPRRAPWYGRELHA